jgi:hypothetical protein
MGAKSDGVGQVNIYLVLPPAGAFAEGRPATANLCLYLGSERSPPAATSSIGRRRPLLTTVGVAAAVAITLGVGFHLVGRSAADRGARPQPAMASVGTPSAPASTAALDTLARQLAQPPRVTPPPSAVPGGGGPSAFGFGQ